MPDFSQQNSPLKVFTPLPENTLLATRLVGREAMGDTFEFTVNLVAALGTAIDFSQLVGQFAYAVVSLPGGASRTYHGMIWEFWQDDSDGARVLGRQRGPVQRRGLGGQGDLFGGQLTMADVSEKELEKVAEYAAEDADVTWQLAVRLRPLLADKGLAGFFSHVYGGDAFPRKKPDPMPLLETCKALGTTPARTLMLGDSQNDALATRAAKCPVVLVTYGYNHGEPIQGVDSDGFIDRIDELTE